MHSALYAILKEGIEVTIDKFNIACKPIEITDSQMKEVRFGINEYK